MPRSQKGLKQKHLQQLKATINKMKKNAVTIPSTAELDHQDYLKSVPQLPTTRLSPCWNTSDTEAELNDDPDAEAISNDDPDAETIFNDDLDTEAIGGVSPAGSYQNPLKPSVHYQVMKDKDHLVFWIHNVKNKGATRYIVQFACEEDVWGHLDVPLENDEDKDPKSVVVNKTAAGGKVTSTITCLMTVLHIRSVCARSYQQDDTDEMVHTKEDMPMVQVRPLSDIMAEEGDAEISVSVSPGPVSQSPAASVAALSSTNSAGKSTATNDQQQLDKYTNNQKNKPFCDDEYEYEPSCVQQLVIVFAKGEDDGMIVSID